MILFFFIFILIILFFKNLSVYSYRLLSSFCPQGFFVCFFVPPIPPAKMFGQKSTSVLVNLHWHLTKNKLAARIN